MLYSIFMTGGQVSERAFGNTAEMKEYVEENAPLRRGWYGLWYYDRHHQQWTYTRYNSKGVPQNGYGVYVRKGAMTPRQPRGVHVHHKRHVNA